MALPYYKQKRDYWCGPATVQMALAVFGFSVTQERLAKIMHTNRRAGTQRRRLTDACRKFGMSAMTKSTAATTDISAALQRGYVVIVNYREPADDETHYAIVKRITATRVVLLDPWHGPEFALAIKEFRRRWSLASSYEKGTRWMAIVSAPVKITKRHVNPAVMAN